MALRRGWVSTVQESSWQHTHGKRNVECEEAHPDYCICSLTEPGSQSRIGNDEDLANRISQS